MKKIKRFLSYREERDFSVEVSSGRPMTPKEIEDLLAGDTEPDDDQEES